MEHTSDKAKEKFFKCSEKKNYIGEETWNFIE